jgi:hypothetical protein
MANTRKKKVQRSIDDPPRVEKRRREMEDALAEAEGEVQQKDGGQDRQAGESVEDQRERIRQIQPRQGR